MMTNGRKDFRKNNWATVNEFSSQEAMFAVYIYLNPPARLIVVIPVHFRGDANSISISAAQRADSIAPPLFMAGHHRLKHR